MSHIAVDRFVESETPQEDEYGQRTIKVTTNYVEIGRRTRSRGL